MELQAKNDPFVRGSPFYWVEGMSKKITLRLSEATSVSSQGSKLYKGTDDVSTDHLTGSASTNGTDTITSPTIHSLLGGEVYMLNFSGVVNGRTEVFLCEIRVLHPWGAIS